MIINIPLHSYHKRLKVISAVIIIIVVFFIASFWYIQIIQETKYKRLSQHNYLRIVLLKAPRGEIFDRNGILLASNRPSFNISLYRNTINLVPQRLIAISRHLEIKEAWLEKVLKQYRQIPPYLPITIKEDASLKEVAYLEARKLKIPEVIIEAEPRRIYLYGKSSAHLLGYIGEVSRQQLKNNTFKNVNIGDIVGKSGLENWYNFYISGINGWIEQKVDAQGILAESLITRKPSPGADAILTIDMGLQRYVETLMGDMIGAAVGLNPNTGDVLFMVSKPSFNPNIFVSRFSQESWRKIVSSPAHPLQNRCINGFYPAGSVFKLILALAALEEGVIIPETRFTCNGSINIYGKQFFCNSRGGHGSVDLYRAISRSCNIYFYQLGEKLGIERIAYYAKEFGFGKPTGIDLPFESRGLIPDPQWKRDRFGKPWYPGETISVAIGQGAVAITPLQLAVFTAAIANKGFILEPRVIKEIRDKNGTVVFKSKLKRRKLLIISPLNLEVIKKGMWGVVNDHGTGWRAYVEELNVAGKTGTAQLISQKAIVSHDSLPFELRDHSWFTCFAPYDKPEIVLTVLIEHGGQGGRAAAPLAGEILKAYAALKEGIPLQNLLDLANENREKHLNLKGYKISALMGN